MVLKKERKSITMNIIKKLLIPVAIAAMVSLGLAGCDKKGKKPAIEQSAKEKAPNEHPTDEHPTGNELYPAIHANLSIITF